MYYFDSKIHNAASIPIIRGISLYFVFKELGTKLVLLFILF
jgi:hypothetical protein